MLGFARLLANTTFQKVKLPLFIFFLDISEPSISPVTSTVQPTSTSTQQKEKKKKKEKEKKKKDTSKGRWVEGVTSDGHCYYYDLITGGTLWKHRTRK